MDQRSVPNHLVYAILVTLFCCLPFGIVSIIHAAKVNSLVEAGSMEAAIDASERAKKWATWGLATGLAINLLAVLLQVALVMASG
jgi:hypothetical protein